MKNKSLILLLFVLIQVVTYAQDKPKLYTLPSPYERYNYSLATFRYTGAVPIGNFSNDYIDAPSFKNYSVSLEWVLQNNLSIGGEIGSTYFQPFKPEP